MNNQADAFEGRRWNRNYPRLFDVFFNQSGSTVKDGIESMQSRGVHYGTNAITSSPFAGRKPG
jgi:hypothetical protein